MELGMVLRRGCCHLLNLTTPSLKPLVACPFHRLKERRTLQCVSENGLRE